MNDPAFLSASQHFNETTTLRIIESPDRAHDALPQADLHIKFRQGLKGRTLVFDSLTRCGNDIIRHINARH